jgi:hypothetical protein
MSGDFVRSIASLVVPGRPADELLSQFWNRMLTIVSLANITWFVGIAMRPRPYPALKISDEQEWKPFWRYLNRYRLILGMIYVVACAIRSIWPRHDGDRHCFYDTWISVVFLGRSLATIAELSYCAQLCLALVAISGKTATANRLMLANVVAQTCCWYSVITQDQRGHTVEETIWLITGIFLSYFCFNVDSNALAHHPDDSQTFICWGRILGPVYVLFMSLVDVPMYFNRYLMDTSAGKVYQTFEHGLSETLRCMVITGKDEYWVNEMPWMSLYFSIAVWSSLWLSNARLGRATGISERFQKQ